MSEQNWKGISGDEAWQLIFRLADGHDETMEMMQAWADANRPPEVDDLAMLVRQLVQALKNAKANSELQDRALEYLKRKNLQGRILRAESP